MDSDSQILLATIGLGLLCLFISVMSFVKQRKYRRLIQAAEDKIEDLQTALKRSKETVETNAKHLEEMSRRLVWLETRIRQPKPNGDEVVDDSGPNDAPKLNITERRHRVATLAARGQSAESIALTIGMMPGEVELILNLEQAARNKK